MFSQKYPSHVQMRPYTCCRVLFSVPFLSVYFGFLNSTLWGPLLCSTWYISSPFCRDRGKLTLVLLRQGAPCPPYLGAADAQEEELLPTYPRNASPLP